MNLNAPSGKCVLAATGILSIKLFEPIRFVGAIDTLLEEPWIAMRIDSGVARRGRLSAPANVRRHEIRRASETPDADGGGGDGPEINFQLMWAWSLRNPLWTPKQP
jgi:hypothetical protein